MNKVTGEFKLKKIIITLAFAVSVFLILSLFFSLKISAWNVDSYQKRTESTNNSDAIAKGADQNSDDENQVVGQNSNQAASQGEGQEDAQDGAQTGYVYRDFTKYGDFFGEATPSNYHGIWAIENIIEVHSDGSADVTEIWRSRAKRSSEQTEVYVEKNFGKLGFDEDSLRVSAGVSATSYEDI